MWNIAIIILIWHDSQDFVEDMLGLMLQSSA